MRLLPLAEVYAGKRTAVLSKELGSGGSAAVFLLERDAKQTALKVYDPRFLDENNGPAEKRRIELQRRLIGKGHPTLVSVVDIAIEEGTCFIEMEYVSWQNLKNLIPETPAEQVESLFGQLVSAVQHLDDQGLVHRDIKPENIMVDPAFKHLKLIDFGVMREVSNEEDAIDATDHGLRRPFIASAQYSSPEYLFRLKEPSAEMWRALTIYQLGGVLHDLLMKKPLFDEVVKTENKFALAMAVLTQIPLLSDISDTLKPWGVVASNCLVKDPALRLSLIDLRRMNPVTGQGAERLKQISERKKALRNAKDAREYQEAQIKHARTTALDALLSGVRQGLISAVDKSYGIVVDSHGDQRIKFEILMDKSVKLQVICHFEWLSAFTPLVANVTLTAALGELEGNLQMAHKAVGQTVAGAGSDPSFVDVMLNAVCDVVAATAEHLALGTRETDEPQFVDAVLLLGTT
jgi:eukaryotic-like serine/threonine-protein kinase